MRKFATMIPTTSSLFAILVYLAAQARQVQADPNAPCYFPGGEFAPGYFACQAFNAPVSACCPAGWTCFSNALCIATTESNSFPNLTLGAVQRGACTNPQWNNYICGSACLDNENRKGELAACGNDRFCCASDFNDGKCDCSSNDKDSSAFTISVGLVQTIIQVSDTTFTGTPSLSIASPRVSTVKASAVGTGTTTQITDGPASTSLTSSETSSLAPTTTPAAPPVASSKGDVGSDSSSSSSSSNGLKIGLGVGIPVAILVAAGALAYLLWWKPRQNERARRISQHDHYFVSTDLAENDPHGPAKYEPYRQAAT